jgi:hypothetical protein
MLKMIGAVLITGFLVGCASIPDVTYTYYPAKWSTIVSVTQTVGCNAAKTEVVVLNTPSVTTAYSSNLDKPFKIRIKDLESLSADIEMTMGFTDDGRLKSINQNTTGQGEAIIKSAVSLATAVGAMAILKTTKVEKIPECSEIDSWGGNKPVTLVYRVTIESDKLEKTIPLDAAPESKRLYEILEKILPKLEVDLVEAHDMKSGPSYGGDSRDVVFLALQKAGFLDISIRSSHDPKPIGRARIVIPKDDTYELPIPKAALFGKQTFSVVLNEAGAVTSVGYGKNVGVAGALNALGAIAGTQTATTEAADLKAQADLIAQQQRLVQCQTKPDQCK